MGRTVETGRIEILDDAMVQILRRKTPAERVAMVFDAEQTLLTMLRTYLRQAHPDWSETQFSEEIARRRRLESG